MKVGLDLAKLQVFVSHSAGSQIVMDQRRVLALLYFVGFAGNLKKGSVYNMNEMEWREDLSAG